jgi:hypothetical protein
MKRRLYSWKLGTVILLTLVLGGVLASPASAATGRQGAVEFIMGSYSISPSPEPVGNLFEKIYGKAGTIRGVVLSSALVWNLDLYFELKEINKSGKLTYSGAKTTLILMPISLGLRYVQPLGIIQPYIGGGIDFYLFYENNPIGSVFNYVRGSHFLAGLYLQFSPSVPVLLNVRVKYTSATFNINNRQVALGGLEYGAGLGLAF